MYAAMPLYEWWYLISRLFTSSAGFSSSAGGGAAGESRAPQFRHSLRLFNSNAPQDGHWMTRVLSIMPFQQYGQWSVLGGIALWQ